MGASFVNIGLRCRGDSLRGAATLPGLDEDRRGHLSAEADHEADEPDRECARHRSPDGGRRWAGLAPAAWARLTPVHHVAVGPATGRPYAAPGDVTDLRGCWRAHRTPGRVGRGRVGRRGAGRRR